MKYRSILIIAIAGALASGCGGKKNEAPAGPPAMPVKAILAKAVKETVKDTIEVVGSLSARDKVTIVSELDSTVTEVAVSEGQPVKKGQTLFRLDDVKTAAVLSEAEAAFKLARLSHDRNKGLLKNNTISQQAYDVSEAELQSARARLSLAKDDHSKATITAPFDGMVGERSVSKGQFITRGRQLLIIVRTDPLDIVGDVPERYMASLAKGLDAEFRTEAYPDKVFQAKVLYVSPTLNPSSRTVRVKADTPNANALLKPGMSGSMSIVLSEQPGSLIIPESCVQMQGSNMTVVRINEAGLSEFVPVQTGKRSKGRVEITSGLNEGDRVVVEGWQKMGPGSPVTAAPGSEKYGVELSVAAGEENAEAGK